MRPPRARKHSYAGAGPAAVPVSYLPARDPLPPGTSATGL